MSEVQPELARKVLSADERNIIQKVSSGETLSPSQREIMERLCVSGMLEGELDDARFAACLRLYALGKDLSKGQMEVIAKRMPSKKAASQRLTTETYKHKLRHYAQQLGLSGDDVTRKLKRWIQRGRENAPPDYPPFDDLPLLAEWWRRNMKWTVPDYILRLETGSVAAAAGSAAAGTAPGEPGAESLPPMELQALGGDIDFDLGLQQARVLLKGTYEQMLRALKGNNLQQYKALWNEWLKLNNQVRIWEKDVVKVKKDRGETLEVRQLNTEIVSIFAVVGQSFTNALMALTEKLAPKMAAAERRAVVLPLRDSIFAHLGKSRFRDQWRLAENGAGSESTPSNDGSV